MKNILYTVVLACGCSCGFAASAADDFASLQKKATAGDAEAMCELGRCYRNGLGIKEDKQQAGLWTQKSASNGCMRAIGLCYEFGYGVATNIALAVEWYRKAADKGDTCAMCDLARHYKEGKCGLTNIAEAVKWYRKSAEKGNARAMFLLGIFYENGRGVKKDAMKATEWVRKAAENGYVDAMVLLGIRYLKGWGAEKSTVTATEWWRKAADSGNSRAMHLLGLCYIQGSGVMKDCERGLSLIEQAANRGCKNSMTYLGDFYLEKNDLKRAEPWFKRLSEMGDDYGKFQVAAIDRKLGYDNEDAALIKSAFVVFKTLVDSDNEWVRLQARLNVAMMYELGQGVKCDDAEALVWYEKAAETGDADAIQRLETLERRYFDEETRAERKKKRLGKGIGSIADIVESAKQKGTTTFTFKGFYLGMTIEAAHRLLVHYDGKRVYSKTGNGLKDSAEDGIFDYPSMMVVKTENGYVSEFVFSRRLIDLIFSSEGKSAEQFIDELTKSCPHIAKMQTKEVMIPDWPKRNAQHDLVWKLQGPMEHDDPIGGGVEYGVKMMNARRILAAMQKPGVCYYENSEKGFSLEITPNEGRPEEQVKFFVLKKTVWSKEQLAWMDAERKEHQVSGRKSAAGRVTREEEK